MAWAIEQTFSDGGKALLDIRYDTQQEAQAIIDELVLRDEILARTNMRPVEITYIGACGHQVRVYNRKTRAWHCEACGRGDYPFRKRVI